MTAAVAYPLAALATSPGIDRRWRALIAVAVPALYPLSFLI
ncbi:hypothetical protein Sru01_41140 [Sphaerisporangium rufum]|uniref:Uncharacterized protein n=1 Tax=Sphaerisporangium rufum TaxID=1381558 RepID=A0A919R8D7_9ACTN|nr:hypothetical protein [Sphaerisporangium rufum]GII79132.1 hypothetical protein Sru01_41140 [Sphaerisporangium rufum]